MDVPKTRYAKTADDAYVAYKVAGTGPIDLVYVPGWYSRLDVSWEHPLDGRFLRSLASFSRLIMVDRRGSGLSDPVPRGAPSPLETLMDDIRAVLDAVGSTKSTLFGEGEGGPRCALFAATYPERTHALILYGSYARGAWAADYPWAWTDRQFDEDLAREVEALAEGRHDELFQQWLDETVPTLADDATLRPWLIKMFRPAETLESGIALLRAEHELDIRAVLPTIQVPTLVMNRAGDRLFDFEEGRWLAGQIPGARFVELTGEDHPPWAGDQRSVIEAIISFLGVARPPPETHRVLATVLFTDIVGSTRKAAELGDVGWKEMLEQHHTILRMEIERHRGREIATWGDGFFATFDGPAAAARCALAAAREVRDLGLEIRAGVHTGEVESIDAEIGGIGVTIGARIASLAGPSEVLVSSTVKDLTAGSRLTFEDAGERELKGVPDRWRLYRVVSELT